MISSVPIVYNEEKDDLNIFEQYAVALRTLAEQDPEDYVAMCSRVRACAEKFDYKKIAAEEIKVINNIFSDNKSNV